MKYQRLYYYFEKALSPFLCDEIIAQGFVNNPDIAYIGGKGIPRNDKEHKNLLEKRNSNTSWITAWWIKNEIDPYIRRANKMAGWNFNITDCEAYQFTKYDEGQFYDWHTDAFETPHRDGPWQGLIRKISITVSLSDPREYEGGLLEFAYPQHEPDKCNYVKAREAMPRGSIIIFPSYTWHRVTPVTRGTRLSLVQWNLGPGYI